MFCAHFCPAKAYHSFNKSRKIHNNQENENDGLSTTNFFILKAFSSVRLENYDLSKFKQSIADLTWEHLCQFYEVV